jgi:N-acetylglutamate synthase-like GNAT family acetyltransferase
MGLILVRSKTQKEEMLIREATLKDAKAIALLLNEMGHQSSAEGVSTRLKALANSQIDRIWVCEKDSQVIGFLSFHMFPRFYAWGNLGRITAMAVQNNFRRQGYARKLTEHAEKYAKNSDCARVEVTSYSHRLDTHQFYKSVGYTHVKSARFIKAIVGDLQ